MRVVEFEFERVVVFCTERVVAFVATVFEVDFYSFSFSCSSFLSASAKAFTKSSTNYYFWFNLIALDSFYPNNKTNAAKPINLFIFISIIIINYFDIINHKI